MKKILIYGYGNPGRQDDGLGVLLADGLEQWAFRNDLKAISFDTNYQLNIEDAQTISEYDMVVFADASIEEISDFKITSVSPSQKTEFTMHAMSPEFVLHLCQSLYDAYPETYLIHIKGYEFEFLSELSRKAKENLDKAINFLMDLFARSVFPVEELNQFVLGQKEAIKTSLS